MRADGHRLGDVALLVEQVGAGGPHVLEGLEGLPADQEDRGFEPVLLRELAVRVRVAVAGEHHADVRLLEVLLELREVGPDHVAEAAGRVPVDEQHAPTSEIRERDFPAIQVRKLEVGDLRPDRQTLGSLRMFGGAWRMAAGVAQVVL